jgi:hypothetical protein
VAVDSNPCHHDRPTPAHRRCMGETD